MTEKKKVNIVMVMVIEKNSGLSLQMFHFQFFPKLFNFGSLFVLHCTTARDGMGFASR